MIRCFGNSLLPTTAYFFNKTDFDGYIFLSMEDFLWKVKLRHLRHKPAIFKIQPTVANFQ